MLYQTLQLNLTATSHKLKTESVWLVMLVSKAYTSILLGYRTSKERFSDCIHVPPLARVLRMAYSDGDCIW